MLKSNHYLMTHFAEIIEEISGKFVTQFAEPGKGVPNSAAQWKNFSIAVFEKLQQDNIGLNKQVERLQKETEADSMKVEDGDLIVIDKRLTDKKKLAKANDSLSKYEAKNQDLQKVNLDLK